MVQLEKNASQRFYSIFPGDQLFYIYINFRNTAIILQAQFEKHESELQELGNNVTVLKQNLCELTELQYVLKYTDSFLLEVSHSKD